MMLATRRSVAVAAGRKAVVTMVRPAGAIKAPLRVAAAAAASGAAGGDPAERLQKAASAAVGAAADAVKNLKVPDLGKLDVDIKQTVTYNFLAQLALTAMSWAIAFFTSHAAMAKGAGVHPTTALLMVGVLLSGYSTYLSYTYLVKVKSDGLNVLQGWAQMKAFFDHLLVNFAGAAATLLALQAEVGTLMVNKAGAGLTIEALAQASANTLLAHFVSIVFLTFMIRKITDAYQRVLEWGESLSKSIPKLG